MSFVKEFPFDLTQEELREYSQRLASGVQEIESMKEARKIEVKERNTAILSVQKEVDKLAQCVATGVEVREVECKWWKNVGKATMDLVRLDSNEIIESRPITDEEKQLDLEDQGQEEEAA